jgi:putative hydrolase of the HAD superfamily
VRHRGLRALCLDLDDTLLDEQSGVEPDWQHAADQWIKACRQLTREVALEELAQARRWYWEDEMRERRGRLDLYSARVEILCRALARFGSPAPRLAALLARELTDYREAKLRLVPGVRELLGRLRGVVPRMALVTNGAAAPQHAKIERLPSRTSSITSRSKGSSVSESPIARSTRTCSSDWVRLPRTA